MGPKRIFWASARPLRPKISEMPAVAAGRPPAKYRRQPLRFRLETRLRRERRRRIGRHPLHLKFRSRLAIVDDHTEDDIRHCGGPIGAKRRQKRRSHGFLHGFWPFSRREAAQLLPRFLQRVARLPVPMAYTKCFARGCPRADVHTDYKLLIFR